MKLQIKLLTNTAQMPKQQHVHDAGYDLHADEYIVIGPNESYAVSTGIAMAIEPNYEVQIRPRSGLAFKHMITVLNSPGTIDCLFRGEVKVILINHSEENFVIQTGDRIAQMVVSKLPEVDMELVEELDDTERGLNGLGSTGV